MKEEFKKTSGIDWTPKLRIEDGKIAADSGKPVEKPVTKKKNQPESVSIVGFGELFLVLLLW